VLSSLWHHLPAFARDDLLSSAARRPLKTRDRAWPRALARSLARAGIRPNHVSAASVVFAAAAGLFLAFSINKSGVGRGIFLLAAAVSVQLRLLCNLLDGLLAVEGGLGSPTGEIWNDLPDRIADPLVLVGAGLAVRALPAGATLGWVAALLALLTAYVRLLGGSLGVPQSFSGPMAKPHRMFAVTVGCLAAAVESVLGRAPWMLWAALVVIVVGAAVTTVLRTVRIARVLFSR
jgi:phosphatidylglycerophosphate synthase